MHVRRDSRGVKGNPMFPRLPQDMALDLVQEPTTAPHGEIAIQSEIKPMSYIKSGIQKVIQKMETRFLALEETVTTRLLQCEENIMFPYSFLVLCTRGMGTTTLNCH